VAAVTDVSARPLPRGYIETLDGWRAVAISLVIVSHQYGLAHCAGADGLTCRLLTAGNPGVQLFFALSGFLICSRLLDERQLTGHISLRDFYVRRAFRILPAALVYLGVVAALGMAGVLNVRPGELAASALFARNYLPPEPGWYTTHFWSLAVEEHFYLLWPAVVVLLPTRRVGRVALGAAIAVAVWRSVDARLGISTGWFIEGVSFFRTDRRLDGLLLGCALAVAFREPEWRARAARFLPVPVLLIALGTFVLTRSVPGQVGLAVVLVAGTVAAPHSVLGGFLERPLLRWLGRLSYSLYLWQQLFSVSPLESADLWHRLPFSLFPTVLLAWASYRLIERPMLRIGHSVAPPVREGRPELQTPPRSHVPDARESKVSSNSADLAFEQQHTV
jgi:peptidoglycan/LPS O-acetylase OafA/YrhL